jgi:hypothetical protein
MDDTRGFFFFWFGTCSSSIRFVGDRDDMVICKLPRRLNSEDGEEAKKA